MRTLFTFGCVGLAITLLADFALVIAARVVKGIDAAGVFILTVTIIADTFEDVNRNAVFGLTEVEAIQTTSHPTRYGTALLIE